MRPFRYSITISLMLLLFISLTFGGQNANARVALDLYTAMPTTTSNSGNTSLNGIGADTYIYVKVYLQDVLNIELYRINLLIDPNKLTWVKLMGAVDASDVNPNVPAEKNIMKKENAFLGYTFASNSVPGNDDGSYKRIQIHAVYTDRTSPKSDADAPDGEGLAGLIQLKTTSSFTIGDIAKILVKDVFFYDNSVPTVEENGLPNYSIAGWINTTPAPPEIILSTSSVDIGNVSVNSSGTGIFTITNTGDNDLIVSEISVDNSIFSINPTSSTIAGEKSQIVTITFTPTAAQQYSGNIIIKSNDSDERQLSILVSGTGIILPPQPPTLSLPLNGATNVSTSPTLSWNASSGAASYTLQVSQYSNFISIVYNQNVGNVTSKQINGLSDGLQYYWRVSASNPGGTSEWSSIWSFTTAVAQKTMLCIPDTSAKSGETIGIPIRITTQTDKSVSTAQFVIDYNSNVLSFQNASIGSDAMGFQVVNVNANLLFSSSSSETNKNILIQISGGGTYSITGENKEVLKLNFLVVGSAGDTTPVAFDQATDRTNLSTIDLQIISGSSIDFRDGKFESEEPIPKIYPTVNNDTVASVFPESYFWVEIKVSNVTDLFGISFKLNYNRTDIVDYVSDEVSSFLGSSDYLVYFTNPDDANGNVSVGISKKSGATGSNGSGVIAKVRFSLSQYATLSDTITFTISEISANDLNGVTLPISAKISCKVISQGITVWPGDTNNDGVINQADVLPIGLYWGSTGLPRINPSIIWESQICPSSWTPINATYADANGDGVVNQGEILAIGLNWDKNHSSSKVTNEYLAKSISENPKIYPKAPNRGVKVNDEFYIEVIVGNNFIPVENLFGVSFVLDWGDYIQYIESIEAPKEGDFFGDDVVYYQQVSSSLGTASIGISRKSGQQSSSGLGVIAKVKMRIKEICFKPIKISILDVIANDSDGQAILLTAGYCEIITRQVSVNDTTITELSSDTETFAIEFDDSTQVKLKFNSGLVSGKTVNIKAMGSSLPEEIAVDPDKKAIEGKAVAFYNIETNITEEFEAELEITFTEENLSAANLTLEQTDRLVLAYFETDISKWWKVPTIIDKVNMTAKAVISHFSIWALVDSTDTNVVPVELSSFTVKIDINDGVVLEWITLSETNNYGFYIEKSTGNLNFKEISFVNGNGNSVKEIRYYFKDTDAKNPGTYHYRLKQVDLDGSYKYSDVLEILISSPKEFKLEQNYPNPFNPETTIKYELPEKSFITLKIYNIYCQEIKTLVNYIQNPGIYEIIWDGTNENGVIVSSGIYLYTIKTNNFSAYKKMIFLK